MKKIPLLVIFIAVCIILFVTILTHIGNVVILSPHGLIANQEKNYIFVDVLIMLCLAIPTLLFAFFISWKYRESNRATYDPKPAGELIFKILWWAIPAFVACVLSVIVWISVHQLDPYKPIQSSTPPLTIQVVALQWKWLFIYPNENIATVNFIQFPVKTPLNFVLTSDAPMNSFWIPSLGGQIYAMAAMKTHLHLYAQDVGDYEGRDAEIDGQGYAGMKFSTHAGTKRDFDNWVKKIKASSKKLDLATYNALAKPSENVPVTYYASVDHALYNTIIMKYMTPTGNKQQTNIGQMKMN